MPLTVLQHLRTEILRRAAKRIASFVAPDDLGEAKVGDSDVPIHVDQDVLWLDVTIDDVTIVHVLEAEKDLSHVKLGQFFREASLLQQVEEQLTTSADIHDEEKLARALKRPV